MGKRNLTMLALAAFGAAAAAVLLDLSTATARAQTESAQPTIDDCHRITDPTARLQCYDLATHARNAKVPARGVPASPGMGVSSMPPPHSAPTATNSRVGGSGPVNRTSASQDRALTPSEAQATAHDKSRSPRNETRQIAVEVAGTGLTSDRKLRIFTTDGMTWDQTQGPPANPPKPGTMITIKRNFMGGHWCKLSKWTRVRCERTDEAAKRAVVLQPMAPQDSMQTDQSSEDKATPSVTPATQASKQRQLFGTHRDSEDQSPTNITIEVASTGLTMNRKLRIFASDGTIWDQTQGPPAHPPKPGTAIAIRRNFMGGHWCEIDRWTSVRCEEQTK